MAQLQITSHVLEPTQEYPFAVTAKCYTPQQPAFKPDAESVTLIVTHASGMHKECWEPVLERIFEQQAASSSPAVPRIQEAWSIDSPNHGEAALLNEKILETTWTEVCEQVYAPPVWRCC